MKDNLSGQSGLDGVHHGIAVLTAHHDHFAGGDSGHLGGGSDLVLILEVVLHRLLLVLDIGIHCVHDLLRLALSRLDDGNAVALHHHGREGSGKIGVAALGQVQQGEQPSEQPQELMKELDGLLARLEELVARINLTNSTVSADGRTITELISHRDTLKLRISVMRGFLDEASSKVDRYSRAEILIQSTVDVSALQKQLDVYSRELRQTDEKLQELNWTTELL